MNYNAVIEKIMPEVDSGSHEPIMIYRDIHGGWHGDFTQNQYGDTFDWVEDVQDPFAVTITGEDMSRGSFPYVYDRILNERLRAEYENGFFQDADPAQLNAIMNMFEENMGEFSSEVTDYLTTLERPLAAVYDMTLISLKSSDPDMDYDHDKAGYFIDAIESEVEERLNNRKKWDISDNQENTITFNDNGKEITVNPDDYTILQSQQIHHRLITLSENPKAEHRYMVCEYWETPRGVNKHMESGITNDYLEALEKYSNKVHYLVGCAVSGRETSKRMEAYKEPGVFEYEGYHFKPYRQFRKGEVERRLKGDSRPHKIDAAYAMRNMSSDFGLGLSKYDWKKSDTSYSHDGFYVASGNSEADIFKCIENGKLYVPHENELFQYNEPPQKEKTAKKSLSERIESGKDKVREADKNRTETDKPKNKKKGVDIDG